MAEVRGRRVVELLLLLVQQPYRYTRRELEARFETGEQTILRDLSLLRDVGLEIERDGANRYAVLPERGGEELRRLLVHTDQERDALVSVLPRAFAKTGQAEVVARKLSSLVDFQRPLQLVDAAF